MMLLGAFMVLIGIATFIVPENLPLSGGFGVLLYGIGALLHWRERRKVGVAKKTTLTSAIMTIAAGLVILVGGQTGIVAVGLIVIIMAVWLIAAGVLEIIGAVIYRKAMTTADLGVQAPGSITSMILGGVLILMGLGAIMEPLFAAITAGIVISLVLIVAGGRMVVSGLCSGRLFRKENAS